MRSLRISCIQVTLLGKHCAVRLKRRVFTSEENSAVIVMHARVASHHVPSSLTSTTYRTRSHSLFILETSETLLKANTQSDRSHVLNLLTRQGICAVSLKL